MELDETQELNGPAPGIPLPLPNGSRPQPVQGQVQTPGTSVCVPCLVARGVVIVAITAALIALWVIQLRKTAKTNA
jgi:hypothetical protein